MSKKKRMQRELWNLAAQVQSLRLQVRSIVYLTNKLRERLERLEGDKS